MAACLAGLVGRPMTTSRSAPLTERYSNPGAVEFKPWMQRYGATVGPNGRYAQFPNQDAGYAVMGKILDTYQNKHGLNTVSGIVNRWAPSNVDNNSTSTYIAKVAAAVGIDPNQPITPEQRPVLMKAMADYEAGRAQPAPNGAAPKMWPPAGQLDPNSPLASLMGMYGREASTAPGPIVLPQQQSAPAVASASYRAPERAPQKQEEGTLASIVRGLTQSFNSPLFQAGAAMVDAGSRGQNIGAGFLAGGKAASAAAQQAAAMRKFQQEELAQAQRQKFWGELTTDPAKAKLLPEGTLDFLKALGPIDGPKVAMDLVRSNQVGALDRMKLDESRRKNDASLTMSQAQLEESRAVNADRMLTQETIRRQRETEMAAKQREAELEAEMFGRPAPKPIPPSAYPAPIAPGYPVPQQQGPVRRMSDEQPVADPMLIQAQAVTPPTPEPLSPPATIRIPRNGGEDVTPEAARDFGQKLLAMPKYRAMGQDIIKQAEAAMEPKGGLEKPAKSEIEKSMVGDINHLARLDDIAKSYDAQYLQLFPRGRNAVMGAAEYVGLPVKPEDQAKLADFASFRAKTIANFNLLLKEASGAAVTEQELRRMMLQEPNAEANGWLSRPDSPTEFMSKLRTSRTALISAIARKNYMRNTMNLDDAAIAKLAQLGRMPIGLDDMPTTMKRWEQKTKTDLRRADPRIKDDDVLRETAIRRQKVFGI